MTSLSVESTAREMVAAVRDRTISARELLDLHLTRIDERNPELNAIVSLDADRARLSATRIVIRLSHAAKLPRSS